MELTQTVEAHAGLSPEPAGRPCAARPYRELSAKTVLAKWKTPADELAGMAKLAGALADRGLAEPRRICLVAPTRSWGIQLSRACQAVGTRSTLCMPPARLSDAAQRVLAGIELLAAPDDESARARWAACGGSDEQARELVGSYSGADALTLMRVTGIRKLPEFEHALTQIVGDERPAEFAATIRRQLEHPTVAEDCEETPIMHYLRVNGDFDYVLFVSCANGLVPGASTLEDPDAHAREAKAEQARWGFEHAIAQAGTRAIVSYFTRIEKETAQRAHIPFARAKHEGQAVFAMVQSTPFLEDWGLDRPSTIGGQALLRMYGLN